ncbi:SIS domain-containing protein [Bacillus sp. JJ1764]|uniref:SIS domain-containing protein n=1 Tax=Bacillus sp. JJ1764 TaxID=3122964 RepID=UPI002FFD588C
MLNFNEQTYLEVMEFNYGLKEQINKAVDQMYDEGFENVFLIGIGGTIAFMEEYGNILGTKSSIRVFVENAAEFQLLGNKQFSDKSIVIVSSESGTTPEIITLLKSLKERGIRTLGFVCKEQSTIGNELEHLIVYRGCSETFFDHTNLVKLLLTARFMYNAGDFPDYEQFVKQLENMIPALVKMRKEFEPKAADFANKYSKEDYHMLTGSGNIWGGVYSMAMCILEEMQWIRTQSVSCSEFFHGALEMLTKDTSLMIFKGEDETRPLAERVENFALKISKKVSVFDTKEYSFEGVDDKYRGMLCPLSTGVFFERIAKHLEDTRKHSLSIRRYYRVMEY